MIKEHYIAITNRGTGHRRMRLAAAFIAGMAVTAILAQTPVAGHLLSAGEKPPAPNYIKSGDRPGSGNTPEPLIGELVYAPNNDSVPSCCEGYPGRQPATQPA